MGSIHLGLMLKESPSTVNSATITVSLYIHHFSEYIAIPICLLMK